MYIEIHFSVSSPPESQSRAVVLVSTPRMYLQSGYFLVTTKSCILGIQYLVTYICYTNQIFYPCLMYASENWILRHCLNWTGLYIKRDVVRSIFMILKLVWKPVDKVLTLLHTKKKVNSFKSKCGSVYSKLTTTT